MAVDAAKLLLVYRVGMGRKAATVEYLERLVTWAGGSAQFCSLTGILPSNLTAYQLGKKPISWKRLRTATEHVFAPAFIPVVEGADLFASGVPSLPKEAGLYALYDSAMRIIYFGKATSLRAEVTQTLKREIREVRPWTGKKDLRFKDIAAYLSAYQLARGDSTLRHDVEAFTLRLLVNNTYNKYSGEFKRVW